MNTRQSGWSTVPATSTNAVPIGGDMIFGGAMPLDASSKHARKVYIGNLPPSITSEQVITQFFNQTLAALLPNKPAGDSIISTYLNAQKRFAFIENRSIEETTFTLGLDGILMDEYALKLRRPQDYNPQLAQQQLVAEMRNKGGISSIRGAWNPMQQQQQQQQQLMSIQAAASEQPAAQSSSGPGIVSTSVEDGPNKVFVGGLPHHMAEHEVKELLQAYGPLKGFHLVKDRELDRSKGFAFCEWRDPSITDIACQSLNGMKIGDRFLNVRRAIPHSAHRTGVVPGMLMAGVAGSEAGGSQLALPYLPAVDIKPVRQQKGLPLLRLPEISTCLKKESTQASRCLAMRRVVPADTDQIDVEHVQKLVDEIKTQAAQFAKVRNARFHHSEGGRILVEFSTPEEAAFAQKVFDRREICGVRADCVLTEMISEMRKACLQRVAAETDMLARLDSKARQMYLEREKKFIDTLKQRREKLQEEGFNNV